MPDISTTNLDSGADSPALARAELLASVQRLNALTRTSVASGEGADLVPVHDATSGAVQRSVRQWLNDAPASVLRFGADPTGATNSAAAFQAAINSGRDVFIPSGNYLISTGLTFGARVNICAERGAKILAGTNGMTVFSCSAGYYSSLHNITIDGNGKTGVVGFDLQNMRLTSGLFNCSVENCASGLIARYGLFGTQISNFSTWKVENPILVMTNGSVLDISHPTLDNSTSIGGTGTGTGIRIAYGGGDNIGVRVHGGYVQGFTLGIHDSGIGTNIGDLYLEVCSTADVYGDQCRESTYSGLQHFGPTGAAAYLLQLTDAVTIVTPTMASGARTALYSIDSSNTNTHEIRPESAAYLNTPTGSLANIRPVNQRKAAFTPVVSGSSTAGSATYSVASGILTRHGKTVWFSCEATWTGHTGTGNIVISGIPSDANPSSYTPAPVFQVHVNGVAFTGPVVCGGFTGSGAVISLQQISTSGVVSLVPLTAAGSIRITGSYSL